MNSKISSEPAIPVDYKYLLEFNNHLLDLHQWLRRQKELDNYLTVITSHKVQRQVLANNFDAQANKTPSCIGNCYHETPAAALNLPAADAKPVAIVTGAAGPEVSSPTLLLIPQHSIFSYCY
jgi:hypothetical protein